jgi:hypothetical protein
MNTDIDLYFVDYEEGSMGSFISILLNLFLSQQTDPSIIDPMGSVHQAWARYSSNNKNSKYQICRGLPFDNIEDFKSIRGFFITFRPEDRLRILCNMLYKKHSFGVVDVRSFGHPLRDQYLKNTLNLDTSQLKEKLEEYIQKSNMGFCRFSHRFMLKVPVEDIRTPYRYLKWNDFLECVSDEYKDRVHSIEFSDITGNPKNVLEILSTATGMPVTPAIEQVYENYLKSQVLPEKLVKVLSA